MQADTSEVEGGQRTLIAATCAPGLIWMCGPDRHFDWFNPAWESYTGRTHDELQHDGWLELIHPEDRERCQGILATSCEARRAYTLDYRLRRHDGQYRWILDTGVPRFAADGTWAGYVGCGIDIDERKQAEEHLADRVRALRLAERRQGAFLSMLSHELRNPLAPIANAASVLRSLEASNPVLVRLREILERQVDRLGRLVEDLVDATRSAQGQISLVNETVAIENVVRAATEASTAIVSRFGHTLDVRLPADASLCVRGDSARLTQALSNVIANAATFTHEASVISLAVRTVGDTVEISISDPGQGMAPEFLPHAFELFAKEEQTIGHQTRGLGVGLTLARRILQLHNGGIAAFSEGTGRGTRMILTLPRIEAQPAAATATTPLAERYRVLIIEDDADARESLRAQMEMWGNEVRLAASAEEGLRTTDAFRPHIVLCDITLPGLDRLEMLKPPRRPADHHRTLFAALTSHGRVEDEARALAAGYDSLLTKPLEPESLARLLRSYANAASAA